MKPLWHDWSDRRRWRREMKNMPLHQLRANVQSTAFYKDPAKQRWWASRWLWRREKLWGNPGLLVAIASLAVAIAGLVGKWLGAF